MTSTTTRILQKPRAFMLVCLSLLLLTGLCNLSYAQTCTNNDPLRQPFFGDLHNHTSYSSDAFVYYVRNTPREAYSFAKGASVTLPDMQGEQTRSTQIDRPLDFVAVTDHAEYFDATNICMTPGAPGYDSEPCVNLRGDNIGPCGPPLPINTLNTNNFWNDHGGHTDPPASLCEEVLGLDSSVCESYEVDLWTDIQAAAEEAYDRSSACEFTSFVGYEFTQAPGDLNNHRNVIFRNADVPQTAFSYSDATTKETAVSELHAFLRTECLEAGGDCDALTIPHNPNLSMGVLFEDPATVAEAEERAFWEPLVEVHQIKGNSECRVGLGTSDEDCGFELTTMKYLGLDSPLDPRPIPERSFVRNVLKDGLAIGQDLGVNPFKLGLAGGTDAHNGTPGNTIEENYPLDPGFAGAVKPGGLLALQVAPVVSTWNPGGLTVAWAEENTRDSLFDAMRRKEVYATSGTRPVVRFFGGWSFDEVEGLCGLTNRNEIGYAQGVPMGGDLSSAPSGDTPTFIVSAMKDPGSVEFPGVDLQRIQIVKGWVDASGDTHEMVYQVAGDPDNGAWVNEATCEPTGAGFNELCEVWTDPAFDPTQPAFYYVRVFENPSCRYSTFTCIANVGINPFDYDEEGEPECPAAAPGGETCCNPAVKPAMQERAWTSPIWYTPPVAP